MRCPLHLGTVEDSVAACGPDAQQDCCHGQVMQVPRRRRCRTYATVPHGMATAPHSAPGGSMSMTACHDTTELSGARTRRRHRATVTAGRVILGLAASVQPAREPFNQEDKLLRIGKITVGSLDEWTLTPGTVTSWHPTAAAAEKARHAPVSSVPVSYMQGQHLRNYCERTAAGLNFSRQIIASCDATGECDIAAMDHRPQRLPASARHIPQLVRARRRWRVHQAHDHRSG